MRVGGLTHIKSRKGPDPSANETPIGTIAKGNNGAFWLVIPVSGSATRRWVQISALKPTEFHTLTNGDSLRVVMGDNKTYVFYMDSHGVEGGWQLITGIGYRRYWTSKGTWMVFPKRKPIPRAPKHTTVLLEVGFCRYTYIDGHTVAHFKTEEPVIDYDAPMGHNYSPYPFAITKSRAYLLGENKSIEWSVGAGIDERPRSGAKDPYDMFYFDKSVKTKSFPWYVVFDSWHSTTSR